VVPDLALAVPVPTDGGRTYVFRLRPNLRYSNGRFVRAADFRRAVERLFRVGSDERSLFEDVVGAGNCSQSSCDLSTGIVTDERTRTVSYRLETANPDFLENMAIGSQGAPVPADVPFHDTGSVPIPGTGPYKIAAASSREIHYVRNPFFREWSHAAQPDGNPDEIVMRFGLTREQEVREVEVGRADWLADNITPGLLPRLKTRAASQLHSYSVPVTDFFRLNTTVPPFDDVRVRRALNLALDRRTIVRLYGGTDLATAACQILPPGNLGYRRYCPYTLHPNDSGTWTGPDFARAKRLVEASGTRGIPITVWGWTDDPAISPRVIRYTAAVLERLGYSTKIRLVQHNSIDALIPTLTSPIQLIPAGWGDTTFGFFETWFACDGANADGYFCDPRVDAAIRRTHLLQGTDHRTAGKAWSELDRQLVDRALWAPMVNEHAIDFVSARVRNYQAHPYWGILADQVWLD
jgi:peptide/nickel transport system substrate-binding protein